MHVWRAGICVIPSCLICKCPRPGVSSPDCCCWTPGPCSQVLLCPGVSGAELSQVGQADFPGPALSQETEFAQDPCPAQGPCPALGPCPAQGLSLMLGEEMHICEVCAGWSLQLDLHPQHSVGQCRLGTGEMQNCSPRADLVLSCSPCSSLWTPGLVLCPWLCPGVLRADSEPCMALLRQLQFPPGHTGAFRTWPGPPGAAPLSTLALSQECLCCQGIATPRKGKAASLFFLLQALSRCRGWEQQGPAQLKVMSFCCWPRASERETEQDTITRMSNTGSLPCRPRLVCRSTGRD